MTATLGVAEAKRRFSELIDRVKAGERIVVERRGKPVMALVPAGEAERGGDAEPLGFAALAGALAEWDDLEEVMAEVYASRRKARDRPPPEFG
jgi:prevent-host-death family protein